MEHGREVQEDAVLLAVHGREVSRSSVLCE
jgi:hypothetical protein